MLEPNGLYIIVRFHDPSRIRELDRALFALANQFHRPTSVNIVTQRFSAEQLRAVESCLNAYRLLPDPISVHLSNYENSYPADARSALLNLGIRASSGGRYLAFLDYDDVIYPEAYALLINQLRSGDAAISFGGIVCKHCQVSDFAIVVTSRENRFQGRTLLDLFQANFCPLHSFVIDKSRVSIDDLYFNESLNRAEDYDFLLRLCAKYRSDFSLVATIIGDYYFKNDGSNTTALTLPTEDVAIPWRYAFEFTELQKNFICLSPEVLRDCMPPSARDCRTISALLETLGRKASARVSDASPPSSLPSNPELPPEFVPPGHFYSPIPNRNEITSALQFAAGDVSVNPFGKSLESMAKVLGQLAPFLKELDPPAQPTECSLYYYPNNQFGLADANLLHAMIRLHKPARIIEVGSGYSSAVMLDAVRNFHLPTHLTFIEPFPERLKRLVSHSTLANCTVLESKLQEAPIELFSALKPGDFLFIDSSHVLKAGSDLSFLYFAILPRLSPGVILHIHDIFFDWEYPRTWLEEGRSWNECYSFRAILQFSNQFQALIHLGYLSSQSMAGTFAESPSSCGSLWLRVSE